MTASFKPSTERWLPVVGWEGFYEVSDRGRVRSVDRTVTYKDGRVRRYPSTVLAVGHHGIGHEHVLLCRSSDSRATRQVHLLVLAAFGPPQHEGTECLHTDGDPKNNSITNMRWGTRSENNNDRVRHGRDRNTNKTHCPKGHPFAGDNLIRRKTGRRDCRQCKNAANRRLYWRKKGLAA